MKRIIAAVGAIVMAAGLAGCGVEIQEIGMSNVTSEIHSAEEMDRFVMRIGAEVARNDGALESVRYLGDELNTDEETLAKLNECSGTPFRDGEKITECVGFCVDYRVDRGPVRILKDIFHGHFRLDPDRYVDSQLWFVRADGEEEFEIFFGEIPMDEYEGA